MPYSPIFNPKPFQPVSPALVSASIVVYHVDLAELRECLRCLQPERLASVVVVDNASEERVREFLRLEFPSVIYIPESNIGYGRAHNLGFQMRGTDVPFHLIVNTDITFGQDVIPTLAGVMNAHEDITLLHPQIINPDGSRQYTVRKLPTPFDLILRRFIPSRWFMNSRKRYLLEMLDCSKAWRLPYFQGSFMLFRSEAFETIGGFDPRFFMYPEDIDITRRLCEISSTVYYPFVRVVHNHRQGSYSSMRLLMVHIVNMIRYFNKWGWIIDNRRREINSKINGISGGSRRSG